MKTISNLFFFYEKILNSKNAKQTNKNKQTKKLALCMLKTLRGRNCLFCILALFVHEKSFRKKKVWNCLHSLNLHHYFSFATASSISLSLLSNFRIRFLKNNYLFWNSFFLYYICLCLSLWCFFFYFIFFSHNGIRSSWGSNQKILMGPV